MWILKTFMNPKHQYVECKYRNNFPTYWLKPMELDIWGTGMTEDFRTYTPIGYARNQTVGETS